MTTPKTRCPDGKFHAAARQNPDYGDAIVTTDGGLRSTCRRCGAPIRRVSPVSPKWMRAEPPAPSPTGEAAGAMTEERLAQVRRIAAGRFGDNAPVIRELLREVDRLRSSPVSAADGALREAAERARMFLNHMIYVADKNGNVECRIPLDRVGEVEAQLRAALSSVAPTI